MKLIKFSLFLFNFNHYYNKLYLLSLSNINNNILLLNKYSNSLSLSSSSSSSLNSFPFPFPSSSSSPSPSPSPLSSSSSSSSSSCSFSFPLSSSSFITSNNLNRMKRKYSTSSSISNLNTENHNNSIRLLPYLFPIEELKPSSTLTTGQSFHWKKLPNNFSSNDLKDLILSSFHSSSSSSIIKNENDILSNNNIKLISNLIENENCSGAWIGVVYGIPLIVFEFQSSSIIGYLEYENENKQIKIKEEQLKIKEEPIKIKDESDKLLNISLIIQDYFQFSSLNNLKDQQTSLKILNNLWNSQCKYMKKANENVQGVRLLRQDPWECLISFICSSNNNIKRITLMLDSIRSNYGNYLLSVIFYYTPEKKLSMKIFNNKDEAIKYEDLLNLSNNEEIEKSKKSNSSSFSTSLFHLYIFPTPTQLSNAKEDDLRKLGMGYRAKYLVKTSEMVNNLEEGYENYFNKLREYAPKRKEFPINSSNCIETDEEKSNRLYVQENLLRFSGVGMKVADCIALFSLDQSEIIPIDTHVWSITNKFYSKELEDELKSSSVTKTKTITPFLANKIGDIFRKKFQYKAGWAHVILFAADLPEFKDDKDINTSNKKSKNKNNNHDDDEVV